MSAEQGRGSRSSAARSPASPTPSSMRARSCRPGSTSTARSDRRLRDRGHRNPLVRNAGSGRPAASRAVGPRRRIRSVQVHDHDVELAEVGQRVAVSLPGVDRAEVAWGCARCVRCISDVVSPRRRARGGGADRGRRPRRCTWVPTTHWLGVVRLGDTLRAAPPRPSPVVAARVDRVILQRRDDAWRWSRRRSAAPTSSRRRAGRAHRRRRSSPRPAHTDSRVDSLPLRPRGRARGRSASGRGVLRVPALRLRTGAARTDQAADPLDPGIPLPHEDWAAEAGAAPAVRAARR